MAKVIRLKRKSLSAGYPTAAQIALGEPAVNTATGKLYFKDDNNIIIDIGSVIVDVTVSSSEYYFNGNRPDSLVLQKGQTYLFRQTDSSNVGHNLIFTTGESRTSGTITTGISTQTSAIEYKVPFNAPEEIYINCENTDNVGLSVIFGGGDFYTQTEIDGLLIHNHDSSYLGLTAKAADSNLLDGNDSTYFATASALTSGLNGKSDTSHNHASAYLGITAKAADADKLDGLDSTYFATSSHDHASAYLGITAKAADSELLDGNDSTYFATSGHGHDYSGTFLGLTAKAADSELLDGNDSTYFATAGALTSGLAGKSDTSHNHNSYYLGLTGGTVSGQITVTGSAPQIKLNDSSSGADDFWLHANVDGFYILTDRDDSGAWEAPYPLQLSNATSNGWLYANEIITTANIAAHSSNVTLTSELTNDSDFITSATVNTLLGGKSDTSHNHDSAYLGITAKATDSDKLDGKDSTEFALAHSHPYAPSSHDHNDLYYTEAETDSAIGTAIGNLVGSAEGVLDTLGEIGDALNDDANFASTMATSLAGKSDTGHTHDYLPLSGGTITSDLTVEGKLIGDSSQNYFVGINDDSPYDSSWGANSRGISIASDPGTAVIHLKGTLSNNATRFSMGVGNDQFYMAFDDAAQVHRLIIDGDGTAVFSNDLTWSGGGSANANTAYGWGNHASAGYASSSDLTSGLATKLGLTAKAADSELLDGNDSTYFATASALTSGLAGKSDTSHHHNSAYLSLSGGILEGTTGLIVGGSSDATLRVRHVKGKLSGGQGADHLYLNYGDDGKKVVIGMGSGHSNELEVRGDIVATNGGTLSASGYNDTNWNTAYGWGNHASAGYSSTGHSHDDLYYTESEVNSLLAGKSDTSHHHNSAYLGITAKAADSELLDGQDSTSFAAASHNHSSSSGDFLVGGGDLLIGGAWGNNHYNSTSGQRLSFGGGNDLASYSIGTNMENYGGNYTKLDLRWHTGIRMGARPQYGGVRFYDNEALGTVIFSVGKDDAHVRVTNNLYVGGNLALHAGNYSNYVYTESEVDSLLGGKSDTSHNHTGTYLPITAKAADSELLDGNDSTYFATASALTSGLAGKSDTSHHHNSAYLGITAKATDSNLLDGLDSSAFSLAHSHPYLPTAGGNLDGSLNMSYNRLNMYDSSGYHSIGSQSRTGANADDIRINTYGSLNINLDSNNNNSSDADFRIGRHAGVASEITPTLTFSGETGNLSIDGYFSASGYNDSNWNTAYTHSQAAHAPTNANYTTLTSQLTNDSDFTTNAYVNSEITDLIGGAPGALDTLNELAAAISDDASYASSVTTLLAEKLPLAGGTLTGDLSLSPSTSIHPLGASTDLGRTYGVGWPFADIYLNGKVVFQNADVGGSTFGSIRQYEHEVIIRNESSGYDVVKFDLGAGADSFVMDNTGKVGIGTDSPQSALHTVDSGDNSEVVTVADGSGYTAGHGPSLIFRRGTTGEKYAGIKGYFNETNQGNRANLGFFTRTSDAVGIEEKVTILHDGNVGFGTTSPGAVLEVVGQSATGGNSQVNFVGTNATSHFNYGSNEDTYIRSGKTSGTVRIQDNTGGNVLISNSSSKLGIGTSTPYAPIHIKGDASVDQRGITFGPNNGSADMSLIRVDGNVGQSTSAYYGFDIKYMGTRSGVNNSLAIFADNMEGTQIEAMTFLQDGKIGIGDSTPATELDVNGVITASGGTNSNNWAIAYGWGNHASAGYSAAHSHPYLSDTTSYYTQAAVDALIDATPTVSIQSTAPSGPDAGDLWFDTTTDTMSMYNVVPVPAWNPLHPAGIYVQDTAPSGSVNGDFWFNTTEVSLLIYYVDGSSSQWIDLTSSGGASVTHSDTPPGDPDNGDLWFDSATATLAIYYYDGSSSQWIDVAPDFNGSSGIWSEASTSVTLVAGQNKIIDTTTTVTLTLPASPNLGDEISVIDGTGNASTNNITINRNGSKIQGVEENMTIDVDRAGFSLVYYNNANGWLLMEK